MAENIRSITIELEGKPPRESGYKSCRDCEDELAKHRQVFSDRDRREIVTVREWSPEEILFQKMLETYNTGAAGAVWFDEPMVMQTLKIGETNDAGTHINMTVIQRLVNQRFETNISVRQLEVPIETLLLFDEGLANQKRLLMKQEALQLSLFKDVPESQSVK